MLRSGNNQDWRQIWATDGMLLVKDTFLPKCLPFATFGQLELKAFLEQSNPREAGHGLMYIFVVLGFFGTPTKRSRCMVKTSVFRGI